MKLIRQKALLDILETNPKLSMQDILSRLRQRDHDIKGRTFKRDKTDLHVDLGIVIEYNKAEQVYFINREKSFDYAGSKSYLDRITTMKSLRDSITKDPDELKSYITTAEDNHESGYKHVDTILKAIAARERIGFSYRKYDHEEAEMKEIEPYHIKEYNQIWYLYGRDINKEEFRVYGLDRCSNVLSKENTFVRDTSIDAREQFRKVMGIFLVDGVEMQGITLEVTNRGYINRLKNKPLHHSQIMEEVEPGKCWLSVELVPNHEFYTEILRLRKYVVIKHPEVVREKMKQILEDALANYR